VETRLTETGSAGGRDKARLVLILAWAGAVIAVLPAILHWAPHATANGSARALRMAIANLLAFAICYAMYRAEKRRIGRALALALVFLVVLLAAIVNQMHKTIVDYGVPHSTVKDNTQWQLEFHNYVIDMDPGALPHSYRFLPNAIVRWMEIGGFSFEAARNLYRMYFGLLIFYALYRFARLYTDYGGAIIAMLLTAVIYPVSFIHYAGQLTDPLSHLSFLLCYIFLETQDFPFFLSSMLIGSLAKETVLALAGYYVLFARKEKHYPVKAFAACICGAATYLGVRLLVLTRAMGYRNVSGVGLEQVARNWHEPLWRNLFLLTAGALVPFLVLGWSKTSRPLKNLALFLFPVIFVSSLFFSWLAETRNFMPLVFVLAVIAGNFLSQESGRAEEEQRLPARSAPGHAKPSE
jgi:hypothetical protein